MTRRDFGASKRSAPFRVRTPRATFGDRNKKSRWKKRFA